MNRKRTIYLVVVILWFAVLQALPQVYTPITGVINDYTSITAIQSAQDYNSDTVVVTDATGFNVDDTVMVYCVKGANIVSGFIGGYTPGNDAQSPGNTGRYAFFLITEKIGNSLVLNASLNPEILPMGAGEVAQLIRVRSYRYANVTASGVTADPWNPVAGAGGVVTMFVHGVLRLDGDIDVSGQGFRGAPGSTDTEYTLDCLDGDTMGYFYLDGELWAGLKGEGTTDTSFPYNRGKGSNINGGGGGNGLLAGGGGGSNYSAGVRGGNQSTACNPQGDSITGGAGGFDLGRNGWYYVNAPDSRKDRIFFGGGGGSGTRPAGANTTDGGNGGGIVVIIADTILGNGGRILANGEDVSGLATNGAGGGGGGGGCIILDVNGYQSTFMLSATGGDGGNTFGTDTTGPGGAGGGGIYWMSGTSWPGVTFDFSTGTNGQHINSGYEVPITANPPFQRDNLVAPLRGFVFNPVPTEFTICSDQDPDPIVTSTPKGGDGNYTYQWIDSSSTQNYWADIVGATSRDYDPGYLTDTIYYRREVTSLGLVDTSFRIDVYVHPAITDNTIAANDTVCSGNAPILFEPTATIGGGPTGGSYTYKWQYMPDGAGTFTDITGISSDPTYQEGPLNTTTDYRRIAYSGVCVSTSNTQQVKVLESLTGNDITPFDTICINTAPDLISGPGPSNGDQGDIRYQWLTSTAPGIMGTVIPGETAINYQSVPLSQTTYIRRIVLSGNDDACRDTSAYVEILNIPDITTNTIGSSQTVCQQDQPGLLTGYSPGGGYLGQYSYTWISSTDQSSWVYATGGGPNDVQTGFDPGVMTGDTTWYRRVVGSGGLELVCQDTSDQIVINVLPSITNNILTPTDDLKCQQEMPEIITGSLPGGGATVAGNDPTQAFRWEVAQIEGVPGPGNWSHPLSGADAQHYTDPNLLSTDVDRWYQRIVTSGLANQCIDTSNLVHLAVHTEITANGIDVAEKICFEDSRDLRHVTLAGGENGITPVYTWRSWLEGQTPADAVDVPGSDQQEYQKPTPYNDPGTLVYYYDRVVDIGACSDTSNAMLVTIMQLPGGALTDASFIACEKDTFLQVNLNMDAMTPGHYVTPWEIYLTDGVNMGIGPGSLVQDMDTMGIVMDTEGADDVTLNYTIESIGYYPEGDQYECVAPPGNLTGGPVTVNLFRRPDPQILVDGASRESIKVCNTTALLEFLPDNGTLSRWSNPAGSVFFSPGSGLDEYNVSIPNNHDDFGKYRIYIESMAGDCAGRDSIDLSFFEQPAPAFAGEDTVLFLINQVQLRADPPTAGTGIWTLTGGSGLIADEHDPNTLVSELGLGEENTFTWTVTNGEDEGVCTTTNDVTIVLRNEVKDYNGFSPNGDMSNEYFIMQGLVYADKFTVSIFNSLGNTVRIIDQDNVGELDVDPALIANGLRDDEIVVWDGLSRNRNPVPSGTYYYVVTLTIYQSDYRLKGYVVVERE